MPTAGETWYATAKWQILQREDFKYQFAEGTLTRYVVFDDRRDLESKVNYVKSLADVSSLVADGNTISGTWRTVSAGASPVNKDNPLGPIMLWHALVSAALTSSDGPYVTENNCTYKVSLTYYWRQAELPANVTAGSSGITYTVTDITRDPKTGLWNYAIEKREQITTYIAEHKIAESQFATVFSQTVRGVRTGDTDNTGTAISALWTVAVTTQGTSITESRSKNDNCTVDITQTKTVAKAIEAEVARTRTAFGDVVTITLRNQTAAVNAYVNVANGIVFSRSSKINDDGTFDNTETQRIATESTASAEMTQTAFGMRASLTIRNQAAPAAAFVTVANGIVTIQSYRKNDDGTYDNTQTLLTAVEAQNAVIDTYKTMFEQGVSITNRNQAEAVNALVEVAGGIVTKRTSKLNDDGTFDNTETLTTAIAAANAVVEKYKTQFETGVSITNRNQAVAVSDFVAVSGGVTVRRTAVLTANGLYDNTEITTTLLADILRAKETAVEGLLTRTTEDTQQVTSVPADITSQTPGTFILLRKTINVAGGTDVSKTTEAVTQLKRTWTVNDVNGAYSVVDYANYPLADLISDVAALGIANHNSFYPPGQPNRYGLYDARITIRPNDGGTSEYAYTTSDSQTRKRLRYDKDKVYVETYTMMVATARGYGCSLGHGNYMAHNPREDFGSEFHDTGGNWYWYKAVYGVSVDVADVTTDYYAGTSISL